MNRIYQGRVAKVEVIKAGGNVKSPEDWLPLGFQEKEEEFRKLEEEREKLRPQTKVNTPEGIAARERLRAINEELNRPGQEALWEHHQVFQDAVNYN